MHAVCDDTGKPVRLLLTEGQTSDDTGARRFLSSLPKAKHLLADRGYDADWLITALKKQSVKPCISPRKNRTTRRRYSKTRYKQRHKIESCSAGSRIGAGSPCGTLAVATPSSPRSVSPQPSSSISKNEF